jgi:hypothetical protein
VDQVPEEGHVEDAEVRCRVVEAAWAAGEEGVVFLQVEVEGVVGVVGNNPDRPEGITRAILGIKVSIIGAAAHSVVGAVIRIRHRHLSEDATKVILVPDETGVMVVALAREMVHSRRVLGVRGTKTAALSQISRLLDWQYLS